MTHQEKMRATLAKTGIASKQIECYGRHIVITSTCLSTANKWALVLGRFCSSIKVLKTTEDSKTNKGTCLLPTVVTVFRTYATI